MTLEPSRKALMTSIVDDDLAARRQRMRDALAAELAARADAAQAETHKAFWLAADQGRLDAEWRNLQRRVRSGLLALAVVLAVAGSSEAQVRQTGEHPQEGVICNNVWAGGTACPCPAIPDIDLPLTASTLIEDPKDCGAYLLGWIGATAYLADLRARRYLELPKPWSGHVITDSESSRFSPWTVRASDHEGTWVMTITEAVRVDGVWRPY